MLLIIAITVNPLDYLIQLIQLTDVMIRLIRTEAGLVNPPTGFSTNEVNAANFIVKYGLHFDPQKPHVIIESVKEVIKTLYRNEDSVNFGKGPYRLRKGFEQLLVNDLKWSSMTAVQQLNKVKEFQKADMTSQKIMSRSLHPLLHGVVHFPLLPWKVESLKCRL